MRTVSLAFTLSFSRRLRPALGARGVAIVFALVTSGVPAAQAQVYQDLYTFTGGADGGQPYAGLIRDAAGNLYGTTYYGGVNCQYFILPTLPPCGVVFKLDTSGKETVLYQFQLGDGANPIASLIRDKAGNLYGTNYTGGSGNCQAQNGLFGCGTIFEVSPNGTQTVLHNFAGPDGAFPAAALIRDAAGNLFGTTTLGGSGRCTGNPAGCGVVFKLDTTGKITVLHNFSGYPKDGEFPLASLLLDRAGNLYGTTSMGGAFNDGIVFKLNKTGKQTVLYTFTGGRDGGNPQAGLIQDTSGNFYGTTYTGGSGRNCPTDGCGTVFKLTPTGKETVVHSFQGSDGANPTAGLVRDSAGNFYSTALNGGPPFPNDCGVVFRLSTTYKETVLHHFSCSSIFPPGPSGGVIRDAAGNLYGTTIGTGINSQGVVFKLTP